VIENKWRIFPQEQRSTDKRFVQTVIRGNLEKIPVIALNKSRRKDFILKFRCYASAEIDTSYSCTGLYMGMMNVSPTKNM